MGKLRGGHQATVAVAGVQAPLNSGHGGHSGQSGRYQQVDLNMTPPPVPRLLNHHGSLSSADSSILYNTSSHPTSPLLSQRSPMHQKRSAVASARHTSVNRHGVVALEECAGENDFDLLQPVYQEPFHLQRGAMAMQNIPESANKIFNSGSGGNSVKEHVSSASEDNATDNLKLNEAATLQLVRKGKTKYFFF